ncbi:MAG: hypothetical protein Q9169_005310 [Polycauliona sp. 2 TL-2023]
MASPSLFTPDGLPIQLFAPLTCISGRQRVATSMGNVIRQLHSLDFASVRRPISFRSEAEPASKQLESGVDKWVTDPGNEMRAVEVWALVRPPTNLQRFRSTGMFSRIINAGGHFHKVLSGGGGWGNRQGLLALDPEADFDLAPELTMAQDFENGSPEVGEGNNSSQIVNPGDIVEFFVCKTFEPSSTRSRKATGSWTINCPPCVVFGTTPSTIDAMPGSSNTPQGARSSPDCLFIPRHFGMLSEQGVSLTTRTMDGRVRSTKIDVPHALFSSGLEQHQVHASPLLKVQSAEGKRSQEKEKLPDHGVFRRYRFTNPDAVTNPPEPKSEYSTLGPAGQNEEMTLVAALARIRKEGWIAVPESRTSLIKDHAENDASTNSGDT